MMPGCLEFFVPMCLCHFVPEIVMKYKNPFQGNLKPGTLDPVFYSYRHSKSQDTRPVPVNQRVSIRKLPLSTTFRHAIKKAAFL